MLKNLSDFLRPFSTSTLLFSINNSTKFLSCFHCSLVTSFQVNYISLANVNSPPPSPYDQNGEVFHIRKSHHHDPLPPIRSSSRGENHDDGRYVIEIRMIRDCDQGNL